MPCHSYRGSRWTAEVEYLQALGNAGVNLDRVVPLLFDPHPAKDILYELTNACSITVASGSRWAAQTTTIGVQVQEAHKNNAAAKVLYYNMVQKPTAANPNYFELEICLQDVLAGSAHHCSQN